MLYLMQGLFLGSINPTPPAIVEESPNEVLLHLERRAEVTGRHFASDDSSRDQSQELLSDVERREAMRDAQQVATRTAVMYRQNDDSNELFLVEKPPS